MFLVTGATGNVGAEPVRGPDAPMPDGARPVLGGLDDPGTLAGARDAGVRHVVLVSGGSAALADMSDPISRSLTLSERAVRDSGMAWTLLRPRAFMSNAPRWAPRLRAGDTVRVPFPDAPAACVDPRDVAAVAARSLVGRDPRGRVHELTGPHPRDQLAVLAEMLGRDLRCVGLTDGQARAEMERTLPAEYVDAIVRPDVQEVTGRPPRTFRQWAPAHAGAFR
ncbi:NAD(P)H-binding protein [Actinomadura kijaniata]|uniref:hypothetical protein n=1 Tax=Actinomadura kijaniata TaxID=46161 RepID=UPI002FEDDA96